MSGPFTNNPHFNPRYVLHGQRLDLENHPAQDPVPSDMTAVLFTWLEVMYFVKREDPEMSQIKYNVCISVISNV